MAHADRPQMGRTPVRFYPHSLMVFDHLDGLGASLHDLALLAERLRTEPERDDRRED